MVFTDEAIDSGNFQKWSPDARDIIKFSGALINDETLRDYAKEIIAECTSRDHTGRCSCDFEHYRPLIERFATGFMPPLPEAPVTSLADVRRTRSDGPVQKI